MILFICLDEDNGMLFNRRRQSSDREVIRDMLAACKGKKLRMDEYSAKLFENRNEIAVAADFLEQAGEGDFCFVENRGIAPYEKDIETLVIYRWNRNYPEDLRLDIDLNLWERQSVEEIKGYSHETIAKEIYARR